MVSYNDFYVNATNFTGYPATYGQVVFTNRNVIPSDILYNIFHDPLFVATNNFYLATNSPCIDAGTPDTAFCDLCFQPSLGTQFPDLGAWGIVGDQGGWIVYDSAPDCNGAPHSNTAEILPDSGNKILKMTVVANDCVTDLSVDLFSPPNIPISTNTLISFSQSGSLANPHWNGFFPTLFPPPGDSIHIFLLDQNKNGVVYIFQRTPQYPPHTTTLQIQFPDGHVGSAVYHEVFVDSSAICFRISVRRQGSTRAGRW